jgi:sporulation protein YlmC with PRC-barrel domain
MVGEEIGRLDDVVVDADQNEIVNLAHGSLLRMILS